VYLCIYHVDKKKKTKILSEGRQQQECAKRKSASFASTPPKLCQLCKVQMCQLTALASNPSHYPQHPQALCISSHLHSTSFAMHHRLIFLKKAVAGGLIT